MIREFQARYHSPTAPGEQPRPVLVLNALVEGADQLRAELEATGHHVLGITQIRAVVDWSKPTYTRDEAAAYLCVRPSTLSQLIGAGEIPRAEVGNGLYPRRWLEQYLERRANPAARPILRELEAA